MNIFYLDSNPACAPTLMHDKHVVKMILESAQLLCTAHHLAPKGELPDFLVKKTHENHPSAKWCRENQENYFWLARYMLFLTKEYTSRYKKPHRYVELANWLFDNIPDIPQGDFTDPPQCMPDEYKMADTVSAYRNYYTNAKRKDKNGKPMMIYTNRQPPQWLLNEVKFSIIDNKYRAIN